MAMMPRSHALPSEADVQLNIPVLARSRWPPARCRVCSFGLRPALAKRLADRTWIETLKESGPIGRQADGAMACGARLGGDRVCARADLAGRRARHPQPVRARSVDLGFRSDRLLTFSLPVPNGRLTEGPQIYAFYRQLIERLQAVPGVARRYGVNPVGPGTGFGMPFEIVGTPVADPQATGRRLQHGDAWILSRPSASRSSVQFTEQDRAGGLHVVIVNQTFVTEPRHIDPLTQRLVIEELIPGVRTKLGPKIEWQIVGVYGMCAQRRAKDDGFPEINVPFCRARGPTRASQCDLRRPHQRAAEPGRRRALDGCRCAHGRR